MIDAADSENFPYDGLLGARIKTWICAHDVEYTEPEAGEVYFQWPANRATYRVHCRWDEDLSIATVWFGFPNRVPRLRRRTLLEIVARLNLRLRQGTWELDPDDGEIRFRAALQCPGTVPSQETVDALFDLAIANCEEEYAVLCAGRLR